LNYHLFVEISVYSLIIEIEIMISIIEILIFGATRVLEFVSKQTINHFNYE
jgi:hypothetical protein